MITPSQMNSTMKKKQLLQHEHKKGPPGELYAVFYCRVSTDDIEEKLPIPIRKEKPIPALNANDTRSGFQQLMQDYRDNKIDMIIKKAFSQNIISEDWLEPQEVINV